VSSATLRPAAARAALLLAASWLAIGGLGGCRSAPRVAGSSPPASLPPPAPAADAIAPPPAAQPALPPPTAQTAPPGQRGVEEPPAIDAAPPPCVCGPASSGSKAPHKPSHRTKDKHAAQQPQAASTPAATPPGGAINAEVGQIDNSLMSILGKKVQGANGEDLGRVVDVLTDASGRVQVAIIDFGGFLGVGTRRVAVDWPLLRFDPGGAGRPVILGLSRQKLQSAPEYKDSTRPRVLMAPPGAASDADATENKK